MRVQLIHLKDPDEAGLEIPAAFLEVLGWQEGDEVNLEILSDRIVVTKVDA